MNKSVRWSTRCDPPLTLRSVTTLRDTRVAGCLALAGWLGSHGVADECIVRQQLLQKLAKLSAGPSPPRERAARVTDARRRRRGPKRVPRRCPSPAKREIAPRRPTPDTAPLRPSTRFGPLRARPGPRASDRPHHAHRSRKRRRPDAPVAIELTARARYDPTGDASRASRAPAAILGIPASDESEEAKRAETPLPYSESERARRVTRNPRLVTLRLLCLAEILA